MIYIAAKHLWHLWNELYEKYKSINTVANKNLPSGIEAKDVSPQDWKFFHSMSFCEKHIQPRPITSSLGLSCTKLLSDGKIAPPEEPFARRKRAKISVVDTQLIETHNLLKNTLQRMNNDMDTEAQPSSIKKVREKNAYLDAILKVFGTVSNAYRHACLIMTLQEIEFLKQLYPAKA